MEEGGAEVTAERPQLQHNWQEVVEKLWERLFRDGVVQPPYTRILFLYGGQPQDPVYRLTYWTEDALGDFLVLSKDDSPILLWKDKKFLNSPNVIKWKISQMDNFKYGPATDMTLNEKTRFFEIAEMQKIKEDTLYDPQGASHMQMSIGWSVDYKGYAFNKPKK